jgi:LAO/AO transport system kinase
LGPASTCDARIAKPRQALSRAQFIDGILNGDRAVLARAITLIESSRDEDRELAEQIVEECLSSSGPSLRVGITGVPGAGN